MTDKFERGFREKYVVNLEGCWLWTAATDGCGYGWFGSSGGRAKAHRYSYEVAVGSIPEGLCIDHLCRVRCCVNPDHLEAVTLAENVRRGKSGEFNAAKTRCPNGHPYDDENTYIWNGKRGCRECRRAADRRRGRHERIKRLNKKLRGEHEAPTCDTSAR